MKRGWLWLAAALAAVSCRCDGWDCTFATCVSDRTYWSCRRCDAALCQYELRQQRDAEAFFTCAVGPKDAPCTPDGIVPYCR